MAHTELDVRDRRLIEDLLGVKASVSTIAAHLDRHRSTIYREGSLQESGHCVRWGRTDHERSCDQLPSSF